MSGTAMAVEVLQSGLLATMQDLGRPGYRAIGVSPGGAMDRFALRTANALLGNPEGAVALEMHFPAPRLRFPSPAFIALGGADFSAVLSAPSGEQPLMPWRSYAIPGGSRLRFDAPGSMSRAYLAIRGGWLAPEWLGSGSAYPGLAFTGQPIRAVDTLPYLASLRVTRFKAAPWSVSPVLLDSVYTRPSVALIEGPEWEWLTSASQTALTSVPFTIGPESNRIGYRLRGPLLERRESSELLSSGVAFGAIQLPPSGQAIVLMADHPVTGGYPRIACVASGDLPYLAQRPLGASVRFAWSTAAEARRRILNTELQLRAFAAACSHRIETWLPASSI